MRNEGGQFVFKVGDRVTVTFSDGSVRLGRVKARTIEPALGKTYRVQESNGRNLGFIPEARLEAR